MAKLKGPLFSFGASGQIAKTLVYFPWKGLNVVRQHVVPTNPQTTLQDTQRDYLTAAVALVHQAEQRAGVEMAAADQVAYSALASAKGRIMTWFNQCVKLYIDVIRDGEDPVVYHNGIMGMTDKDDFRPVIYFTEETLNAMTAGVFWLGSSPTNLNRYVNGVLDPGVAFDIAPGNGFDGLTAGRKYYWQLRPTAGSGAYGADSGIYYGYAT